jgi:hypothetical protein
MTLLGIVVPAILAVLALRRWIVTVPWRIVVLLLALTLGFLHGAVFTSKIPVPVDEVARGYPWRGLFPEMSVAKNPLTNDTSKLFLPWMEVVREEFSHGRMPLWNRYSFSGYPLLANGEAAPFSPFFLATLFVSLPKQIVAMAGLKIFFSLLFTYLLLKRFGASDGGAVFAACTFAFCTFQTVYLYYSTTAVTALLPAAVYSLLEAADNARRSRIVLVAFVMFALMANGHPESVLHIAICAVIFLALEGGSKPARWIGPLQGVAAGMLVSAPTCIPVLEQVLLSTRLTQVGRAAPFIFPPNTAWSLIAPTHFGNPINHDWNWFLNYAQFATSYAGIVPLVVVAWAALSRRTPWRVRALIAIACVSFLVAMNWTFVGRFVNSIPPFSIAANDKLRFVAVFIIAIVAGRSINRFGWLAALLVVLDLFYYNAPFNALVDAKYFRPHLPIVDAIRAHPSLEPFRIVGRDWVFLPNASAHYQLEDVRGSDPMELASYARFFETFGVQEPGTDVKRVQDVDRPELDFLNVRFLLAEPDAQLGGKWKLLYRGVDGSLFENLSFHRRFFSSIADVLAIRSENPSVFRVHLRAAVASSITSSQPNPPGWTVSIDGGKKKAIEAGTFIRFDVPPGEHTVKLAYQPKSFYWSLIGIPIGIAMMFVNASRATSENGSRA